MTIGINLCPAPQISEHCPRNIPGRFINIINWFIRPGMASAFTPIEGIVHEWRTSFDLIIIRVGVIVGITKLFVVVINRNLKEG